MQNKKSNVILIDEEIENIKTNKTNIFFPLALPTSKINEFTKLYLNNKSINYIYKYELDDQSIFIYRIKINEPIKLNYPEKGEIRPYFIRKKFQEYISYYCIISYYNYKNNFIYDLDWKIQGKNDTRRNFNIYAFDRVYITLIYLLYLQKLKEDKDILKDFLNEQINKLDASLNINFTEFLLLL